MLHDSVTPHKLSVSYFICCICCMHFNQVSKDFKLLQFHSYKGIPDHYKYSLISATEGLRTESPLTITVLTLIRHNNVCSLSRKWSFKNWEQLKDEVKNCKIIVLRMSNQPGSSALCDLHWMILESQWGHVEVSGEGVHEPLFSHVP